VLTLLLLIVVTAVMAQKKSVINLIRSKSIQGVKINGVDVLKVYGGTFQQDYSTLTSDSAYFHQAENTFDAFGHVIISQGDTLNIYSDKLNYNGNTKIAILTDNVRMVDKDAILTTNYLTYNTATKYGTYTNGGKLVNKDNTLTSKNGYYFANSRDSYFRYDVVLLSPDAITKTDTLRYNTGSKIAYFYGPTHIYGKKKEKEKDNDTLYTENGLYNTVTEQAFFGKKNLYSQGTKTLKGDSMFYDRKKGYGRVVKNITFNDNEQKMSLKGDLGTYFKSDERTVVTENAYAIIVTEERDTSKNDSVAKKTNVKPGNTKKAVVDTAKAFVTKIVAPPDKPNQPKADIKKTATDTTKTSAAKITTTASKPEQPKAENKNAAKSPSVKQTPKVTQEAASSKKGANKDEKAKLGDTTLLKKDTVKIKHDSVYITSDTLETRILTYKDLKAIQEKIRLANIIDTTKKAPTLVYKTSPKYIEISAPKWIQDTIYLHRDIFNNYKPRKVEAEAVVVNKKTGKREKNEKPQVPDKSAKPDKLAATAKAPAKKLSKQDSIKQANKVDSVYLTRKIVLSDTSRIRILSAFHNVKLFKSDLQGKSDSAFYSTSDSIIHLYVKPMIWAQASQLSGDTINLQMKNKKFDNIEAFLNAFSVNVEKGDSTHFNQAAGKKMRGFFNNDKLERLFMDGNAETIYFSRDSGKISGMQRSLSSRIRMNFKDSKLTNLVFLSKPEHRYGPLDKFTEEDKILKGFIWKPKERPVSKESIIPSYNKKAKVNTKVTATSKPLLNKPSGVQAGKDTSAVKPPLNKLPDIKAGKDTSAVKSKVDSTLQSPGKKVPDVKTGKDTSAVKFKVDSTLQSAGKKGTDLKIKKDSAAAIKPNSNGQ
jgi:lipopolysaccharide export system protein LptA